MRRNENSSKNVSKQAAIRDTSSDSAHLAVVRSTLNRTHKERDIKSEISNNGWLKFWLRFVEIAACFYQQQFSFRIPFDSEMD